MLELINLKLARGARLERCNSEDVGAVDIEMLPWTVLERLLERVLEGVLGRVLERVSERVLGRVLRTVLEWVLEWVLEELPKEKLEDVEEDDWSKQRFELVNTLHRKSYRLERENSPESSA